MPPMKAGPNNHVDFGTTLETSTKRQKEYLTVLDALSHQVDPRTIGRTTIGQISLVGGPTPLQRAITHFKDSPEPVPTLHDSVKQLGPRMDHFKEILFDTHRDGVPDDLSVFYKQLRDSEGVFFGEMVSGVVSDMFTIQPKDKFPITSQMLYVKALSNVLFTRVKPRHHLDETMLQFAIHNADKRAMRKVLGNENRIVRLERMLKYDFEYLAIMQICSDYVARGLREAGVDTRLYEWPYPPRGVDMEWQGRPGKKTTAIYDVPGLKLVTEFANRQPKPIKMDLIMKYGDILTQLDFLEYSVLLNAAWHEMRGQFFTPENVASLDEVPETEWKSLHLAREVPSCQRVFFENNKQPFFIAVDPAYDNTYLAALSITDLHSYMDLEKRLKSSEAAREVISPLSRPFMRKSYSTAESMSFLIRKDDGELSTYGDTNSIPRAQLGEHYYRLRNFIHESIIKNLCHTEYVPGSAEIPPSSKGLGIAEPITGPQSIPDEPILRKVPPEEASSDRATRMFRGRGAHTRLLPSGWMPGYEAWKRARESPSVELFAEIFDDTGRNAIEDFKLDLSEGDFQRFRNQLLGFRVKYRDRIRFETYVKKVDAPKTVS